MKTLMIVFILILNSFAKDHRITMTCTFKALAKGYESFTVSERMLISDEGSLRDDDGLYGRSTQQNRKITACNPKYYPVIAIFDGKTERYIRPAGFHLMPYSEFRNLKMSQDEQVGTFVCKVVDGWRKR